MKQLPTAEEFLNKEYYHILLDSKDTFIDVDDIKTAMIEFAKLHVEKILELQHLKYYAGETGYIKKEEWEELITNIK